MPFNVPIVSRAWLRPILRHSGDAPEQRAYNTAVRVLTEVFGSTWVKRHLARTDSGNGFFYNNFANEEEAAQHLFRITTLAEILVNLQPVRGYAACVARMQTSAQIEPKFAELEVGKLLYLFGVGFELDSALNNHGLVVEPANEPGICAETGRTIEAGEPREPEIAQLLDEAQAALPPDQPGIIFLKVPTHWLTGDATASAAADIARRWLDDAAGAASVVYYTMAVAGDGVAAREIPTEDPARHQLSQPLFPAEPVDSEALFLSAKWFRLR